MSQFPTSDERYAAPPQEPGRWLTESQIKRETKRWPWAARILVIVLPLAGVALGMGAGGGSTTTATVAPPVNDAAVTPSPKPAPEKSASPKPKAQSAPKPAAETPKKATSFSGDGIYMVGSDIEPGRYKASVADSVIPMCSWSRLSATDGDLESIIASDLKDKGTLIVTIKKSDEAFETSGCTDWVKVN